MHMTNSTTIPASVEITWRGLNDPDFLKDCIAGCESIECTGDNEYKVLMAAKVGPVSARFVGRMVLEELQPPRSYAIRFEGQGGAAGFAKGKARVSLQPEAGNRSTAMSYQVEAQVGGKLAQIGSRLIDAAARKVADDFFSAFTAKISRLQQVAESPAVRAAGVEPAAGESAGKRHRTVRIGWWAAGLAAAAAMLWVAGTRIA